MMLKKMLGLLLAMLVAVAVLAGCSSTVDEPCMYCNHGPSREYEKRDGTPVYVCEEYSSVCMICGDKKATKHYESLLGVVFVCDDCYEVATNQ